jgi:hypothetical protein
MYCKEDCCPCPIGTDCNAAILLPITLADLPLSPGYFRPNSSSIDVRRCPDAAANCDVAESTCLNSTSACVGGRDTKRGCLPGINGTFCRGCEDPNSFYVGAVEGAYATCRPCVEVVSGGTLEVVIVAAIVLAVGMILSALYALYVRVLARAGRDDEVANLSQALHDFTTRHTLTCKAKILVGFYMIATKIEDVYEVFLPPDVRLLLSRMRVVISIGIEGVPLSCIGAAGYTRRLLFWMLAPGGLAAFVLLITLATTLVVQRAIRGPKHGLSLLSVVPKATPMILRIVL